MRLSIGTGYKFFVRDIRTGESGWFGYIYTPKETPCLFENFIDGLICIEFDKQNIINNGYEIIDIKEYLYPDKKYKLKKDDNNWYS